MSFSAASPSFYKTCLLLLRVFFVPLPWMRWVLLGAVVLAGAAFALNYALPDLFAIKLLGIVALILIGTYFAVGIAFLPGQILSIGSSKQFYLLGNFRNAALAVLMGACVLTSLGVLVLAIHKTPDKDALRLFCAIFLFVSIIFTVFILLAHHANGIQFLAFMGVSIGMYTVPLLMAYPAIWLLAVSLLIWAVFSRWWLLWKPRRYSANFVNCTPHDIARMQAMQASRIQSWFIWFGGADSFKAKSLLGTLLFGASDGLPAHLVRAGKVLLIFGVAIIAMKLLSFNLAVMLKNMAGFWLFLMAISSVFGGLVFRNIHKAWLYTNSRQAVVAEIEVYGAHSLLANSLMASALLFFAAKVFGFEPVSVVLLLLLLLQSALFVYLLLYLGLVVYTKTNANMRTITWIKMPLYFLTMAGVMVVSIMWDGEYHEQVLWLSVAAMAVQALALIPLRKWAITCIAKADFVRVIS